MITNNSSEKYKNKYSTMIFEVKDNNPLLKSFIYTCTLPTLIDADSSVYPHTVLLPVIKTGSESLNDEWILRIWQCTNANDKIDQIKVVEEPIDSRIMIDLSLFHASYDFHAICSLKFCTCEQSIDSVMPAANDDLFKKMSIGSTGTSVCLDPHEIAKHFDCYGNVYKLIIYITIPKIDVDRNTLAALIKNPNNPADEYIFSDDKQMGFLVVVDGEKFCLNVRKWSLESPLFHVLLCEMWKENMKEYVLHGIRADLFRTIWIWIENDHYLDPEISVEQAIDVANLLQVNDLRKHLESVIIDRMKSDDWQKYYLMADKLDLQVLRVESLLLGKIKHSEGTYDHVDNFDENILRVFYDKFELVNIIKPFFDDDYLKTDLQMILPIQHDHEIDSL